MSYFIDYFTSCFTHKTLIKSNAISSKIQFYLLQSIWMLSICMSYSYSMAWTKPLPIRIRQFTILKILFSFNWMRTTTTNNNGRGETSFNLKIHRFPIVVKAFQLFWYIIIMIRLPITMITYTFERNEWICTELTL